MMLIAMTYWTNFIDFRGYNPRINKYASKGHGFVRLSGQDMIGSESQYFPYSSVFMPYSSNIIKVEPSRFTPAVLLCIEATMSFLICTNSYMPWFAWSVAPGYDLEYFFPINPSIKKRIRD